MRIVRFPAVSMCYLVEVETCTVCMSGKCFTTELIFLAKELEFKANLG